MKIIVTGASGMLGKDLVSTLIEKKFNVISFPHSELDICELDSITEVLEPHQDADWLINCAAYTLVDECEKEKELAFKVNGTAVGYLASYCSETNIKLIHFSTDYVFDGRQKIAYNENDAPNPINVYGASKLEGEKKILFSGAQAYIFRIQWLYGKHGPNFVHSMQKLFDDKYEIDVVDDQWGTPTWTMDIVMILSYLLKNPPKPGIYHLVPEGVTTWYRFAEFLLNEIERDVELYPVTSEEFPRPARRPKNGQLSNQKFIRCTDIHLPHWQESVSKYLKFD